MNRRLTIRLPDKLRNALARISKKERIPVSNLIRESIRRYTAVYRTGDDDLLSVGEHQGVKIVSLRSFWERMKRGKRG
jgi:metal-responsive CopG/Arc/MetJ family transcriptional regulator